jgi:hypothetical protein
MKVSLLILAMCWAGLLSVSCSSDSSPLATKGPDAHEVGWLTGNQKPDTTKPSGEGCKCPPESISFNFAKIEFMLGNLIDDVTPPPGEPVGLLLPAVQKVREAASRARTAMVLRGRDASAADALIALVELLEEEDAQAGNTGGGNGAGKATLNDLILSGGTGGRAHIKSAKLFVRKQGSEQLSEEAAEIIEYLMGYACAGIIQIADEEQPGNIRAVRAALIECVGVAGDFAGSVEVEKRVRY